MTDLPAGRELDALIAEKVMGLKVYHHAGSHDVCHCDIEGDDDITVCQGPVKAYSTSIADAWEVVERMGGRISLQGPGTEDMGEGYVTYDTWTAEFQPKGHQTGSISRADTAPLAICLASLKACGVE